ncbi:MAG: hypothetical protein AB7Q42_04435 [Acidimicrobiia bacterium]
MSLAIDVDTVSAVLLADGWHDVHDASFSLDSYEFVWSGKSGVTVAQTEKSNPDRDPILVHGGGQSGICATGFAMNTGRGWMYGPLTSVLAVRTTRS